MLDQSMPDACLAKINQATNHISGLIVDVGVNTLRSHPPDGYPLPTLTPAVMVVV